METKRKVSELAEGGEGRGPLLSLSFQLARRGNAQSLCHAPKIEGPFCRPLGTQRDEGGTAGGKKVGA